MIRETALRRRVNRSSVLKADSATVVREPIRSLECEFPGLTDHVVPELVALLPLHKSKSVLLIHMMRGMQYVLSPERYYSVTCKSSEADALLNETASDSHPSC
jgi:hypothetical protein